jgi:bifunctional UDP-N-acetylglucosamine pyrophosphorylase/glucosamine-1-phosphate N-acetyltransferase
MDCNITFNKNVTLSDGVKIDQNCILEDCTIGKNVHIKSNSVVKGCVIEANSFIGPYARIRPKTIIGSYAQIGNFVEIKNSVIGNNCRINHLTFIGDAQIENNVTIGAGTITCNFDGANTQKTYIEKEAFIGSGVYLIAPIRIGNNATIGSGSTITKNAPPNKLTLARTEQTTNENWKGPKTI